MDGRVLQANEPVLLSLGSSGTDRALCIRMQQKKTSDNVVVVAGACGRKHMRYYLYGMA